MGKFAERRARVLSGMAACGPRSWLSLKAADSAQSGFRKDRFRRNLAVGARVGEGPESTLKSHSWPRQQNRRVGRQAEIQGGDGMP